MGARSGVRARRHAARCCAAGTRPARCSEWSVMPNMVEAILLSVSHLVIAAACARASTSLSAREHAHNQQPHVIVRAGADAGAGCVVRVSGLRTASHSQARRAGCTPITRSSLVTHAERTRPGQLRSCADEAPVRNAATCATATAHDRRRAPARRLTNFRGNQNLHIPIQTKLVLLRIAISGREKRRLSLTRERTSPRPGARPAACRR